MSLFNWITGKDKREFSEMKRFTELIIENNKLSNEINVLYKSLKTCGYELYERTGKIEHCMPEHWKAIAKNLME